MSRAVGVLTYIADVIVAASLISVLVATLLTQYRADEMTDLLDILANPAFWIAVLRIATPLIFGTLGALLRERAGVLNLGIEGIMVVGAFTGWLAVYAGAPLWVGVGVAALVGALFGLLHAGLTVGLALSQHVSGLGITLLATALSYYGYCELSEGEHAAHRHAVRTADLAAGPGAERADRPDPPCTRAGAGRRLGALSHAAGPGGAHGRRNPQAAEGQGVSVRPRAPARSSLARR